MANDVPTVKWAKEGVPDNPRSWLMTVAHRRLVDNWRSQSARRRREETNLALESAGGGQSPDRDDTLSLLFMCCHPSLSVPSQLALTLRAVGGLTTARRAARTNSDGFLVPLDEQQRALWNQDEIAAGVALLTRTLGSVPLGPYQLQAAIAAVHDEAANAEETDWPQILALYDVLERVSPGPTVTLNRAVAVARVHGPRAGLALLGTLETDDRMANTHRLEAVRAHLLELAGEVVGARDSYRRAARMTAGIPEQRYLALRAARLG